MLLGDRATLVAALADATPAASHAQERTAEDIVRSWSGTVTATNPELSHLTT